MKIEFDKNIEPSREQAGLTIGKALRVGKDAAGTLVLTPDGNFVIVNKRGVKRQNQKEVLKALIIAARKTCNLSQTQLADKIDATRATVASWENDLRNPTLITVMAILWICKIIDQWNGIEK